MTTEKALKEAADFLAIIWPVPDDPCHQLLATMLLRVYYQGRKDAVEARLVQILSHVRPEGQA